MKIWVTMSDTEFDEIEKYINCDEWANPMQDEFVFYNPSEMFKLVLLLKGIKYWDDSEEDNK
jgi:hypothetical protein